MIQFAYGKGALHAIDWIKECLSNEEAGILYDVLRNDSQLTEQLIALIPGKAKYYAAKCISKSRPCLVRDKVQNHEVLQLARQNIKSKKSKEQREYESECRILDQQKSDSSQKYTQSVNEKSYYDGSYIINNVQN